MSSSNQQPFPLVWFVLVDSATGEPYKGTSASSVSLGPDTVIDQFRDAVKAKYSNKLSSVDPGELIVYENKTAFVEGKHNPLEEDCKVEGFGESKKKALVVVVPSSTQFPIVSGVPHIPSEQSQPKTQGISRLK
jgi:hypothetical protein